MAFGDKLKLGARVQAMSSLEGLPIRGLRATLGLLLLAVSARGQSILPGSGPSGEAHLFNTDAAVLESQEPRKDLPCTASVKPTLGFDLKFHSGYEVNVPLKELARAPGSGMISRADLLIADRIAFSSSSGSFKLRSVKEKTFFTHSSASVRRSEGL